VLGNTLSCDSTLATLRFFSLGVLTNQRTSEERGEGVGFQVAAASGRDRDVDRPRPCTSTAPLAQTVS
jgi:hypothetical protein